MAPHFSTRKPLPPFSKSLCMTQARRQRIETAITLGISVSSFDGAHVAREQSSDNSDNKLESDDGEYSPESLSSDDDKDWERAEVDDIVNADPNSGTDTEMPPLVLFRVPPALIEANLIEDLPPVAKSDIEPAVRPSEFNTLYKKLNSLTLSQVPDFHVFPISFGQILPCFPTPFNPFTVTPPSTPKTLPAIITIPAPLSLSVVPAMSSTVDIPDIVCSRMSTESIPPRAPSAEPHVCPGVNPKLQELLTNRDLEGLLQHVLESRDDSHHVWLAIQRIKEYIGLACHSLHTDINLKNRVINEIGLVRGDLSTVHTSIKEAILGLTSELHNKLNNFLTLSARTLNDTRAQQQLMSARLETVLNASSAFNNPRRPHLAPNNFINQQLVLATQAITNTARQC